MTPGLTLFLVGGAALVLDFLLRYGAYLRGTGKIGVVEYVKLDPVGWTASVVCSFLFWMVLPELDAITAPLLTGIPVGLSLGHTPLGAMLCGYFGSSVGPKVLTMLSTKVGVR